jgi:hypothetical protein
MRNVKHMAAMFAAVLFLAACGATTGAPFPHNNTGGPPPVMLKDKSNRDMSCCKGEDGKCPLSQGQNSAHTTHKGHKNHHGDKPVKDMPCCEGKDGICPLDGKLKASGHEGHSENHGQHGSKVSTAFDAAMDDMHKAMGSAPVTGDPDTDFAAGMIPHHQGAVDMAKVLLDKGHDPKLRRMAREIIVAQQREIAFLEYWLQTRGETPASNISNVNVYN